MDWIEKAGIALAGLVAGGVIPFLTLWWKQRREDNRQYTKGRRDEAAFVAEYYRKLLDERDARYDTDLGRMREQIELANQCADEWRRKFARLEDLHEDKCRSMTAKEVELIKLKARMNQACENSQQAETTES